MKTLVLFFLGVTNLTAWGATQNEVPSFVEDAQGRRLSCSFQEAKLVALSPNLAEILKDLGVSSQIVGVGSKSYWDPTHPAEDLGPYHSPDIEKILALKPGLILGVKEGFSLLQIKRLQKFNKPVFIVSIDNLDSLLQSYQKMACLIGKLPFAEKKISEFSIKLLETKARLKKSLEKHQAFMPLISIKPPMGINQGAYTHSALIALGVPLSSFPHKKKYPELEHEWLLRHSPEIFIWFDHEGAGSSTSTLLNKKLLVLHHPAWIQPSLHLIEAAHELEGKLSSP